MIAKTFSSLGLSVGFNVPESIDEYTKLGGDVLADAIANIVYRGPLAEFRELFCEKLGEKTSIERLTKEVGEGDKARVVFAESEAEYVKRVLKETGTEIETYQSVADEVAAAVVFDPSQRERKPKAPSKPSKVFVEAAKRIIADGKADKFGAKYNCTDLTEDGIARALKAIDDARKQELVNNLGI